MNSPRIPGVVGRLRSLGAAAVLVSLCWPASALLPLTEWHWHLWGRLREAGRDAPDTWRDGFNRRLIVYIPARGPIGFASSDPPQSTDVSGAYGFLQYSLAPRQLIRSTDYPVVILYSPNAADPPILHDPRFTVIAAPGDGWFVLRNSSR